MTFKLCKKCSETKDVSEFSTDKRNASGLGARCKSCNNAQTRARYHSKLEYNRIKAATYYKANKEAMLLKNKTWRLNNLERARELDNAWNKRNSSYCAANTAKRRASKLRATPKWLTEFDIDYMKFMYAKASHFKMHVDHIIPLQGVSVRGLHVPWNLQLLEPSENISKGNRYE
jgi:hypothetical protein